MEENQLTTLTQEEAERIIDEAVKKSEELLGTNPMVAQVILKQLLRAVPNHPQGLQLLGLCAHRMGSHAEAVEIINVAIEVDPESAENHNNIALAYACLGNFELAIEHLETAVKMKPEQYVFMSNLALQLRQVGKHQEAIEMFKNALAIEETAQVYTNLGGVYGELRQLDEAIECFEKALEIDPECAPTHVDMAYSHHLKGEWDEGFTEYEWRFKHFPQLKHYQEVYDQEKAWTGKEDLNGKTILLYGEQGLGDMIMFARYIPKLKDRGAKVVLHCSPVLRSIFDRCDYIDQTVVHDIVANQGEGFPEHDYQCSTMSLPYLLGSYKVSNGPYLKGIDNLKDVPILKEYQDHFNIGIMWAGSPAHPKDASRSCPLRYFKTLYNMPQVKLFSFQMDTRERIYKYHDSAVNLVAGAEDMTGVVNLAPLIQNFDDTAFFLLNLDLLITVDTAILHLAGALGTPAWGLIPASPDWRWKIDGKTTHWYPSVRLFRQDQPGDWEPVFKEVKNELEALLQNQRQELRKV